MGQDRLAGRFWRTERAHGQGPFVSLLGCASADGVPIEATMQNQLRTRAHRTQQRPSWRQSWRHAWIWKCLVGGAIGLSQSLSPVRAQEPPAIPKAPEAPEAPATPSEAFSGVGDPLAPAWTGPAYNVPNMLGDFVARGLTGTQNTFTTTTINIQQPLKYTGTGAEGQQSGFSFIQGPVTVNGPKGPFTLSNNIPTPNGSSGKYVLAENPQLTPQVRNFFPGAAYTGGSGVYSFGEVTFGQAAFEYNYLFVFQQILTSGQVTSVNLANPSGGGLVGRNKYFDNGNALPQDRVFFNYNHIGDYRGLGTPFSIDRYVFGGEKTFFGGTTSVQVRIPFAGTANSDQIGGQGLQVGNPEFGNLGLLVKTIVYQSPNLLASVGLGTSLPTADDSRMIVNGVPVIQVQNRSYLITPVFGAIWAPSDRFYTQFGAQFDFDPNGNSVRALNSTGGLSGIGTLNDQSYYYLSGAAGYWIYQNPGATLSAIALQGECHYNRSFGRHDSVQAGAVTVTDLTNDINFVNATAGLIFFLPGNSNFSLGASVPISGNRQYDWNLIAQFNYRFGPR